MKEFLKAVQIRRAKKDVSGEVVTRAPDGDDVNATGTIHTLFRTNRFSSHAAPGKRPRGVESSHLTRLRRKENGLGKRVADDFKTNVTVVEPSGGHSLPDSKP